MATKSKLIGDLDNEIDYIYTDNFTSQSQLLENYGAYFYGHNEVKRATTDETELIEVDENWVDTNCQYSEDVGESQNFEVDEDCVDKNCQYADGGYCHENQDCISEIELIEVDEDWVGVYDGNGQVNWRKLQNSNHFKNYKTIIAHV